MHFFSIRKDGYPTPPGMREIHDYFRTTQPPEFLDSTPNMDQFAKIYGNEFALRAVKTRKVPENVERHWLFPGIVYEVGEKLPALLPGIPAPGEPAWVARLEEKLDALLDRMPAIAK